MAIRRLLKTPTLGGMVFWTDLAARDGWRVQHNRAFAKLRLLKPYRLLDPNDYLCASANTLEEMSAALPGLIKDLAAKDPLVTGDQVKQALIYLVEALIKLAAKGKGGRMR